MYNSSYYHTYAPYRPTFHLISHSLCARICVYSSPLQSVYSSSPLFLRELSLISQLGNQLTGILFIGPCTQNQIYRAKNFRRGQITTSLHDDSIHAAFEQTSQCAEYTEKLVYDDPGERANRPDGFFYRLTRLMDDTCGAFFLSLKVRSASHAEILNLSRARDD